MNENNNMLWKRIALFALLIGLAGGIGFFIYYVFFRAPSLPKQVGTNVNNSGTLPTAGTGGPTIPTGTVPITNLPGTKTDIIKVDAVASGGITQTTLLANVPTTGASMSNDGGLSYYNKVDGKFYRIGEDGVPVSLSSKTFPQVESAVFNKNGNQAIIEFPDGANIFYDFNTGEQNTLPRQWEAFDFAPKGDKIVAKSIGRDRTSSFLVVSNPDGSTARAVQELGDNADQVKPQWSPNNQIIATATTGQFIGLDAREVFFVGQNQENFKALTVPGINFEPLWATDGSRLLFSSSSATSDYKPQLWVVDASGDNIGRNRKSLNINTWASKCSFADAQTVYCAVPDRLETGAGLQPTLSENTPDNIYKIDILTGLQTKIATPQDSANIKSLMISPDRNYIYYTNTIGETINRIRLK